MFFIDEKTLLNKGDSSTVKRRRKVFSKDEDEKLLKLIQEFGAEHEWEMISKRMPGRTARQCKERYYSSLSPDINKNPWSNEEDCILLNGVERIGQKWTDISFYLLGRTPNSIKNRYNLLIKKRNDFQIAINEYKKKKNRKRRKTKQEINCQYSMESSPNETAVQTMLPFPKLDGRELD
ncbi:Myb-like DNA-binding domain containing protein [Tritrichomonas foetus]|uniref:Myb-like DNA-binding domain containing protein n=1 Tax=Tritrichomonas foetus TaxID=1144522 RepID=A0A1J4KTV6_9EUKA|nr:Myb-like DNA-binding domain containing protein [Tritrichomonas foetus]|eukprot:OHT14344.1 Myb-like DNA-binding domain containing protein [Tritrichomonas foetus]